MDFEKACKILNLTIHSQLSHQELKEAFKKASLESHPDKGGSSEKFHAVKQAFEYIAKHITTTVIEIMGIVEAITLVSNDRNHKKLAISCRVPDNEIREIKLKGFYPIREGDVISGFVNTEKQTFINEPVIQISTNKASVLNMFTSFRIKGTAPSTWENVYFTLNNICKGDPTEVVNTLSRWAYQLENQSMSIETLIPSQLRVKLSEPQWKSLLTRWNNSYSMRSLYLLGMTKQEIRASEEAPDILYQRCVTNPWSCPCIPLEKCEIIDQRLGRKPIAEQRFCGKVLRTLFERTYKDIHCFMKLSELKKLYIDLMNYKEILEKEYRLIFDEEYRVYYKPIFEKEKFVSEFFMRCITQPDPPYIEPVYEKKTLTDEQKEAISLALNTNLCIITGSGGTGKSTIVAEIVKNNDMNHVEYVLSSFTGKAASRLKEVSNRPAYTLDFLMGKDTLETIDQIVIDEFSMTSLDLIYRVCLKLSIRSRIPKITLVGDPNQLLPIGYGFPFRELIKIKEIPRIVLTKNHRLDGDDIDQHGVMLACEQVLNAPPCHLQTSETFSIIYGGEDTVKQLLQQFKESGYDQSDIACITPYKEAVKRINEIASKIWHPDADHTDPIFTIKHITWRVGDRIMVNVNLYNIGIMNGEIGIIESIDESYIYVSFYEGKKKASFRYVIKTNEKGEEEDDYEDDDDFNGSDVEMNTSMLSHGYAMTVHKSQGSEYNYGINYYPYVQSKGLFITKELIYTQFSRSKVGGYLIIPQGTLRTLELCTSKSAREMRMDVLALKLEELITKNKLEEEGMQLERFANY